MDNVKEIKQETIEDIAKCVCERVKNYFNNKDNRKAFEKWYKNKYHKDYDWNLLNKNLGVK